MKAYKIYNKKYGVEARFFRTRKEAMEYRRSSDEKWSIPVVCECSRIFIEK